MSTVSMKNVKKIVEIYENTEEMNSVRIIIVFDPMLSLIGKIKF